LFSLRFAHSSSLSAASLTFGYTSSYTTTRHLGVLTRVMLFIVCLNKTEAAWRFAFEGLTKQTEEPQPSHLSKMSK